MIDAVIKVSPSRVFKALSVPRRAATPVKICVCALQVPHCSQCRSRPRRCHQDRLSEHLRIERTSFQQIQRSSFSESFAVKQGCIDSHQGPCHHRRFLSGLRPCCLQRPLLWRGGTVSLDFVAPVDTNPCGATLRLHQSPRPYFAASFSMQPGKPTRRLYVKYDSAADVVFICSEPAQDHLLTNLSSERLLADEPLQPLIRRDHEHHHVR